MFIISKFCNTIFHAYNVSQKNVLYLTMYIPPTNSPQNFKSWQNLNHYWNKHCRELMTFFPNFTILHVSIAGSPIFILHHVLHNTYVHFCRFIIFVYSYVFHTYCCYLCTPCNSSECFTIKTVSSKTLTFQWYYSICFCIVCHLRIITFMLNTFLPKISFLIFQNYYTINKGF